VHLVAGPSSGGAAKGALLLHKALLDLGVASSVINNSKTHEHISDTILIFSPRGLDRISSFFKWLLSRILVFKHLSRKRVIFNTGLEGVKFEDSIAFRKADIVHYHWVNGLVSIDQLVGNSKHSVWTLRDMWPFTGGCHYSMDCKKYETGCGKCPILQSKSSSDLTSRVIESKKRISNSMKVVGVSSWISEAARNSEVFRKFDVRTIHNAIDTKLFTPVDEVQARINLSLPLEKKVFLIGASNVNAFYKGFDLLLEAIPKVRTKEILFVVFGKINQSSFSGIDADFEVLGEISSAESLRMLYSAADAAVVPSRMDAFPKVIIEALSCGTPVVCFDTSSFSEIVDHRRIGYVAEAFSSLDLAKGIDWAANLSSKDAEIISKEARQIAETRFDIRVAGEKYLLLYKEMLGLRNSE
jgi:glycosyltransferase involved in cell wall biosynthesis